MLLIGLTGGIGMGKSTASEFFRQEGAVVIDTDDVAREVVQPGSGTLLEIEQVFGRDVLTTGGALNRGELAKIVFADPEKRKQLEHITHPKIREGWLQKVERARNEKQKVVVVVIPLLHETGADKEFQAVLCVACRETTQLSRLRSRGWSQEQITGRLNAQWSAAAKMLKSDFVLWNEGPLDVLHEQVRRVLAKKNRPVDRPVS